MKTKTDFKILELVKKQGQIRVHDLILELNLSPVAIHKQLKKLLLAGKIRKIGHPPLVFYRLKEEDSLARQPFPEKAKKTINRHYLYVSPRGEIRVGTEGFWSWLKATGQEKQALRLAERFSQVRFQANKFFNPQGWLEVTPKLKTTFKSIWADRLLCLDWYSLPEFGKTRLGQLVLHAKQAQNRELINQLVKETRPLVLKIIKAYRIDTVAFVPHTVPRKLQFLPEYRRGLRLILPEIKLVKVVSGKVIVAQKTLAKLEERVINARETIFIAGQKPERPKRILLIDDAVGSGATINETGKKLKEAGLAKVVIGFALVSSFKGFDVLREI